MDYLKKQLISYLGNKRSLLNNITEAIELTRGTKKVNYKTSLDLFSGSGVVARLLKLKCKVVYTNDLELYSKTINDCFLYNLKPKNKEEQQLNKVYNLAIKDIDYLMSTNYSSWVREFYAPKNENNITKNDRVFYTIRNARYLDCAVKVLNNIDEPYRTLLWGPLLSLASKHVNTAAMFKGFYKDKHTGIGKYGGTNPTSSNLDRICSNINLELPILFYKEGFRHISYNKNANDLVKELPEVDLAYLDPPYNQHPYASNYFMLNHLLLDKEPKEQSIVVGIPKQWNRSDYNKKQKAEEAIRDCVSNLKSKKTIISYSTSGFINDKFRMSRLLSEASCSYLDRIEINYNNLSCGKTTKKKDKEKVCTEYLFII